MANYQAETTMLENLLWEFGLKDAVSHIQVEENESPALICIVSKGNSSKVIATVFNEFDYFPKYVVIREIYQETYPNIDVKYLI